MSEDQSFAAEPEKKGSKIWLILLILVGLPTILCGGCCGCMFFGKRVAKNSEPYQTALKRVVNDEQVIDRLGEPIEDGLLSNPQYKDNGNTGEAQFTYGITGPNGTARVETESVKEGGSWRLTKLTVTFGDDGSTINLLPGGKQDGGLEIDLNLGGGDEADSDQEDSDKGEASSDSGSSEDGKK